MKLMIARKLFATFSIRPKTIFLSFIEFPAFFVGFIRFKLLLKQSKLRDWSEVSAYPCLADKYVSSGIASGHYFWQDLAVARKIFLDSPSSHLDIGSRVDGFIAHLACFRKITVIDIRPNNAVIPNVEFVFGDIMSDAGLDLINKFDSISCLHALEHFGLGRYGDPIDPNGHIVALQNISNLLNNGGRLYLSVPIGRQRIEYNAHRVFAPATLPALLSEHYKLIAFSYVNDLGEMIEPCDENSSFCIDDLVYQGDYGCGIYTFQKF